MNRSCLWPPLWSSRWCSEKHDHDHDNHKGHKHKKEEAHDDYHEAVEDCEAHLKKIDAIFKKGDPSKAHSEIEALAKAAKGLPKLAKKEIASKHRAVTSECAELEKIMSELEKAAHENKKEESTLLFKKVKTSIAVLEKLGAHKAHKGKHDHKH